MSFRENLIKYRKLAGYERAKDFAYALGIPYGRYLNYEKPSSPSEPRYSTLVKIADLLNVSTDTLLGRAVKELSTCEACKWGLIDEIGRALVKLGQNLERNFEWSMIGILREKLGKQTD